MGWSDDAAKNRALWTESNREYTDENAADNWALDEISWGIWGIDESELNVLGDVAGLDVVELGCGTAYFSAWLAKLGARPTGVDITPAQLDTARRLMAETGIEFPLVEADAARDRAARRLRRPGASPSTAPRSGSTRTAGSPRLRGSCARRPARLPAQLDARRSSARPTTSRPATGSCSPQFGMRRFEWPDGGVEFHLPHGEWIDLLRANGFEIERLIEIQAPADAETHHYYAYVTAEWAKKWPSEEIWAARKRA